MSEVEIQKIYLPEDVGDRPSKLGLDAESKYSVSLNTDNALVVDRGSKSFETLETDQFGFNCADQRVLLFSDINQYGISEDDWYIEQSTSEILNPLNLNLEGYLEWTGGLNATTAYIGFDGGVRYDQSAIVLDIYPSADSGSIRESVAATKNLFKVEPGNSLFVSFGVQCEAAAGNENVRQFGLFNGETGWLMEVRADGSGDNFSLARLYKDDSDQLVKEYYSRGSDAFFDKMDGTGVGGWQLDFSNVVMLAMQIGSYDAAGVDCYAYVPDKAYPMNGATRWIKFASIPIGDNSQSRAILEQGLPIAFVNRQEGASSVKNSLVKYGTSAIKNGTKNRLSSVYMASSPYLTMQNRESVMLVLRTKLQINGKNNTKKVIPKSLKVFASNPVRISFYLYRSLPNEVTGDVIVSEALSGADALIQPGRFNPPGQVIGILHAGFGESDIDLSEFFGSNRRVLTSTFKTFQVVGTAGRPDALSQDVLYITARPATTQGVSTTDVQFEWQGGRNASDTYDSGIPPYVETPLGTTECKLSLIYEEQ